MLTLIPCGRGPPTRCRDPSRGPPNGREPPFYLQPVRAGPIRAAVARLLPRDRLAIDLDMSKIQISLGYCHLVGTGCHHGPGRQAPARAPGRGEEEATWPYALFANRGSNFGDSLFNNGNSQFAPAAADCLF